MKNNILYFLVVVLCNSVQSQMSSERKITGSWINIGLTEYYEAEMPKMCDIKDFDNDKFVPLFLSFVNKNEVKVTFRYEQTIHTYKVDYSKPDSTYIYIGQDIHKIYVENDTLKLKYNQNLISFRKVSDSYSSDVFGEYMKRKIFMEHKNYLVTLFKENYGYSESINESNFKQKFKKL